MWTQTQNMVVKWFVLMGNKTLRQPIPGHAQVETLDKINHYTFDKYLLCTYHILITVLSSGDAYQRHPSCPQGAYNLERRQT